MLGAWRDSSTTAGRFAGGRRLGAEEDISLTH